MKRHDNPYARQFEHIHRLRNLLKYLNNNKSYYEHMCAIAGCDSDLLHAVSELNHVANMIVQIEEKIEEREEHLYSGLAELEFGSHHCGTECAECNERHLATH